MILSSACVKQWRAKRGVSKLCRISATYLRPSADHTDLCIYCVCNDKAMSLSSLRENHDVSVSLTKASGIKGHMAKCVACV